MQLNFFDKKTTKFLFGIFFVFAFFVAAHANANILQSGEISSCGELAAPGTYTLTTDISGVTGTCFTVSSDNVIIDGAGFTVSASGNVPLAVDARARDPLNGSLEKGANGYTNLLINNITFSGFTEGVNISGNDDLVGSGINAGYGGQGGDVAIYYSKVGNVISNGGNASTKGYGASGGNISFFDDPNLDISNINISALGGTGTTGKYSDGGLTVGYSATGTLTTTNTTLSSLSYIVVNNQNISTSGAYIGGPWPTLPGGISACGTLFGSGTYTLSGDIGTSNPVTGSCFNISSDSITIDGQGHTINGTTTNSNFFINAGSFASTTLSSTTVTNFSNLITSSSSVIVSGYNIDLSHQKINANTLTINYVNGLNYNTFSFGNLSNLIINGNSYGAQSAGIAPLETSSLAWTARDSVRDWFSITSSSDGTKLAAVAYGGIYTSTDSGATWTQRTYIGDSSLRSITSSSDGTKLATAAYGDYIYTSTDSGATWTSRATDADRIWLSITSSSDGTKLAAVDYGGKIYTSTDSGVTWTARDSNRNWQSITSSSDGTKLAAVVNSGQIYTSTDSGATWTARDSSRGWQSITSSADGKKLAAVADGDKIYTSTDSGQNWTARDSNRSWTSITSSSDGTKLAAIGGGQIYVSTNSGLTWTATGSNRSWSSITSSSDGTKLATTVINGQIYTTSYAFPALAVDFVYPTATSTITIWSPVVSWGISKRCQYSYTGSNWADLDCSKNGSDIPRPQYGPHTLYIKGTDFAGDSVINQISFTYNLPLAINSPLANASVSASAWNPSVNWDPINSGNIDTCQYSYDNFTTTKTASCSSAGVDILTSSSTGATTLSIKATDSGGGTGTTSVTFTFTKDITSPITRPVANSSVNHFTWSPLVDWGDSITCAYSYDNFTSSTTVACSNNGSDILPPTSEGSKTLYVLGKDGGNNVTTNASTTFAYSFFAPVGPSVFWVAIASSPDGTKLAAIGGNQLYISTNSGATWTAGPSRNWYSITFSDGSAKLVAGTYGGRIYISTDLGATWTATGPSAYWYGITSSSDGTKLAAVAGQSGQIYTSTDGGVTWTARDSNRNWNGITSSADGTKLAATASGGQIYTSTDSGATWTARDSNRSWQSITSSADGTKLAAVVGGGQIYTSTDSGANWTARDSVRLWTSITSSADGTKLAAVVYGGKIYTSTDSGANWTARDSNRNWNGITSSADGSKLAGVVNNGQVYIYNNLDSQLEVDVLRPSGNISSWSPYISWGKSTTCQYSWDNSNWNSVTSCSSVGSGISTPSYGAHTLYIKGTDINNFVATSSSSFNFLAPLSNNVTSCGYISSSGTYTLSQDITGVDATCFVINANSVTINGAGHSITSASTSNQSFAISVSNDVSNFTLASTSIVDFSNAINSGGDITISGNNVDLSNQTINASSLTINYTGTLTTTGTILGPLSSLTINGTPYGAFAGGAFPAIPGSIINSCQTLLYSGTYTLGADILNVSGTCFTINSNGVTIDGAGFAVVAAPGNSDYAVDAGSHINTTLANIIFTGFGGGIHTSGSLTYSGATVDLSDQIINVGGGTLSINYTGSLITNFATQVLNALHFIINGVDLQSFSGNFSWSDNILSSCGTITSPGVYKLNGTINDSSFGSCFIVRSDGVVIDGNNNTVTAINGNPSSAVDITEPVAVDGDSNYSGGGNAHKNVGIKNITFANFPKGINATGVSNDGSINNNGGGWSGGNVSLLNVRMSGVSTAVDAGGGDANSNNGNVGGSLTGGAGGNILITNSSFSGGQVLSNGGGSVIDNNNSANTPANGANAGKITVASSTVGHIYSNGSDAAGDSGVGTNNGTNSGGLAGQVTLDVSSHANGITATAGSNYIPGCTDSNYTEYNSSATYNNGSCATTVVRGCPDPTANNYVEGVNTPTACTYNLGCMDPNANNYDQNAVHDNGTCSYNHYSYCVDSRASDYNSNITVGGPTTEYPNGSDPVFGIFESGSCSYYSYDSCSDTGATNYNGVGVTTTPTYGYDPTSHNQIYGTFYDNGDTCTYNSYDSCSVSTAANYNNVGIVTTNPAVHGKGPAGNSLYGYFIDNDDTCKYYGTDFDNVATSTIIGSFIFDGHNNYGTVSGDASFTNGGTNYGDVTGAETLSDFIANNGAVNISSPFYGTGDYGSLLDGIGNPITEFDFTNGRANNNVVKASLVTFGSDSTQCVNNGIVKGNATFYGLGYNAGTVNGDAILSSYYYNGGDTNGLTPQASTLDLHANWTGIITGNVYASDGTTQIADYSFNGTTTNEGTINGNVAFHNQSFNEGIINGNVVYDTAASGTLTFSGDMQWIGTVSGTKKGTDDVAVSKFVFDDNSLNQQPITGDVVFNDSSHNNSTTTGAETFNNSSINNTTGVVVGSAEFNDSSSNQGKIVGDATFNTSGTAHQLGTVTGNAILAGTNQSISNANVQELQKINSSRDTLYITSGTTITANNISLSGADADNLLTIQSTVPGSFATLSLSGVDATSSVQYVVLKDIHVVGGPIDLRGKHAYDNGGNSGFIFDSNASSGLHSFTSSISSLPPPPQHKPDVPPVIPPVTPPTPPAQKGGGNLSVFNPLGQPLNLPVRMLQTLNLTPLPTFNDTGTKGSFSFLQPISNFVFSPLPKYITDSKSLANLLKSNNLASMSDLVALRNHPLPLPEIPPEGLFGVSVTNIKAPAVFGNKSNSSTTSILKTSLSSDSKYNVLQKVSVLPNTDIIITLKDATTGDFNGTAITFIKGSATVTTPKKAGRYYLTSPSASAPLAIDVKASPKPQIVPASTTNTGITSVVLNPVFKLGDWFGGLFK